jgi:hypothetical protein
MDDLVNTRKRKGKPMTDPIKITAIRANLEALNALLQEAAARVAEAAHYITEGEQNAAIGTVVGLDQTLESAQKLLGAAFALHRA